MIRTTDLWYRKQLLYQLSHNHFPGCDSLATIFPNRNKCIFCIEFTLKQMSLKQFIKCRKSSFCAFWWTQVLQLNFAFERIGCTGSRFGSVGRAVTSASRGLRIKSSHWQKLILHIYSKLYRKRGREWPFLKDNNWILSCKAQPKVLILANLVKINVRNRENAIADVNVPSRFCFSVFIF